MKKLAMAITAVLVTGSIGAYTYVNHQLGKVHPKMSLKMNGQIELCGNQYPFSTDGGEVLDIAKAKFNIEVIDKQSMDFWENEIEEAMAETVKLPKELDGYFRYPSLGSKHVKNNDKLKSSMRLSSESAARYAKASENREFWNDQHSKGVEILKVRENSDFTFEQAVVALDEWKSVNKGIRDKNSLLADEMALDNHFAQKEVWETAACVQQNESYNELWTYWSTNQKEKGAVLHDIAIEKTESNVKQLINEVRLFLADHGMTAGEIEFKYGSFSIEKDGKDFGSAYVFYSPVEGVFDHSIFIEFDDSDELLAKYFY
ncbi:hypothetical protein GT360_19535 [Vibrio astriarenae]|uniref:DUF3298 domain-containing protein n=1 Tax=Vibrio astriarenae TaxID=1481923 RepID=A0A7Z2YFS7_9VIBR|nr:hypothetical protein [Vibrio astriarenae]QIA65716.1 hypothetical protein GT360_19535 [Vibrio astriarenae]